MTTFNKTTEDITQMIDYIVHLNETPLTDNHKALYFSNPLFLLLDLCYLYSYMFIANGERKDVKESLKLEIRGVSFDESIEFGAAVDKTMNPEGWSGDSGGPKGTDFTEEETEKEVIPAEKTEVSEEKVPITGTEVLEAIKKLDGSGAVDLGNRKITTTPVEETPATVLPESKEVNPTGTIADILG